MRKIIAVACLGILSGVLTLNAEDEAMAAAAGDKEVHLRSVLPPGGVQMVSEYLLENDPKKFEELKKLRLENHEEFEKQMVEVSLKMRERTQQEGAELKALSDKYRETRSDADKAALKSKLQELMRKRIEMQKRRIVEMEKGILLLKANVAEEEKKIQEKIDERLKEILSNKDAKTNAPAK
ncbi:MAG: hypothetical protein WC637_13850 [Victivallales bacterium]